MPVFLKWIGIFFNTKKERKGSVGGKGGQDIGRERQKDREIKPMEKEFARGPFLSHIH